jgi:hypothetical protein
MSDLRNQLLDRMNLYGFSEHTKHGYVSSVKGLAKFYNQSPDQLTDEQVRDYFRHLLISLEFMQELSLWHHLLLQTHL